MRWRTPSARSIPSLTDKSSPWKLRWMEELEGGEPESKHPDEER
jgi:hypothetical protein